MSNRAEKLGKIFELGFKEALIKQLSDKEKFLIAKGIKEFEPFIDNLFQSIVFEEEMPSLPKEEIKKILNYYSKMRKVGFLAGESYIKDMLFYKKEFNPTFLGRIFELEKADRTWENADILFVDKETLYIFELTLLGGKRFHDTFINANENKTNDIDLSPFGINIEVGYEKNDLLQITEKILNPIEKQKNFLIFSVSEYAKLLQALEYSFSFLYETDLKIKNVFIAVIYPFIEGLKFKAKVPQVEKSVFKNYFERIIKIRDKLKPDAKDLQRRLFESTVNNYIEQINNKKIYLEPKYPISKIRQDVENIVFEENSYGQFIALCHCAGAGKTTAIMKKFLTNTKKEKILFFYFSPRRAITEDKKKELIEALERNFYKGLKIEPLKIITLSNEDVEKQYKNKGLPYKSIKQHQKTKSGFLREILRKIQRELIKQKNVDGIAIFTTMQAITTSNYSNTISHIINIIEGWKNYNAGNYKVFIVLDEILADNTGLFKIKQIAQALKKFQENIRIYILDANLSNGKILQNILNKVEEYSKDGIDYLPASIYELEGKDLLEKSYTFEIENWQLKAYGKPSFVGKGLNIRFLLNFFENEKSLIEAIAQILKKEKEKIFVYIQNKDLAKEIKDYLNNQGKKATLKTAYIDDKEENKTYQDYDTVIATSSISRGIDVPFKKAYGFFYEFNSEQEVAEFYQAVSRLRGLTDEKGNNIDEKLDRDITVFLFRILPPKATKNISDFIELEIIEKSRLDFLRKVKTAQLLGLRELILSTLESYINPNKDKKYFISIPEIKQPYFSGKNISFFKEMFIIAGYLNVPFNYITYDLAPNQEAITIYPFKFYINASGYIEIPKSQIKNLRNKIQNETKIKLSKRKEYIKNLNDILSENKHESIIRVVFQNLTVVEYIPINAYDLSINQKFRLRNKYISRKNLSLVGSNPIVKINTDKKLMFSIIDDITGKDAFNPKIPLEILTKEIKLNKI